MVSQQWKRENHDVCCMHALICQFMTECEDFPITVEGQVSTRKVSRNFSAHKWHNSFTYFAQYVQIEVLCCIKTDEKLVLLGAEILIIFFSTPCHVLMYTVVSFINHCVVTPLLGIKILLRLCNFQCHFLLEGIKSFSKKACYKVNFLGSRYMPSF